MCDQSTGSHTTSTMAARKRQVQNSDQNNGKATSNKGNQKAKPFVKGKTKSEDSSRHQGGGKLYKICLVAAGEVRMMCLFILLSIHFYDIVRLNTFIESLT